MLDVSSTGNTSCVDLAFGNAMKFTGLCKLLAAWLLFLTGAWRNVKTQAHKAKVASLNLAAPNQFTMPIFDPTWLPDGMPTVATTKKQIILQQSHGTPKQFAEACQQALGEISWNEARAAVDKYKKEWEAAQD